MLNTLSTTTEQDKQRSQPRAGRIRIVRAQIDHYGGLRLRQPFAERLLDALLAGDVDECLVILERDGRGRK